MAMTRTATGLCVANLHATNDHPELAAEDVLEAAAAADRWAGEAPLLFGGDLNLRPAQDGWVFEELASRHGLRAPTDPDAIDHLLVRGMAIVSPAARWPAERRELDEGGLRLRLSDHSGVEAVFDTGSAQG
jgi:hypothetical protein